MSLRQLEVLMGRLALKGYNIYSMTLAEALEVEAWR